jgi:hypothetical protein
MEEKMALKSPSLVLGHPKLTLCGHQELTHPRSGSAFVATRN